MQDLRARDAAAARERYQLPLPYPALLAYERTLPDWIHRSAYDFVFSNRDALVAERQDDVALMLSRGACRYICAAPSCLGKYQTTMTLGRISVLMQWLGGAHYIDVHRVHDCIAQVISIVDNMSMDELRGPDLERFCQPQSRTFNSTMAKLELLSHVGLWHWTPPLLDDMKAGPDGHVALAAYLWSRNLSSIS